MRTSYSKLSVMVAIVALGTTACSSGPTSPTAPKFHMAAPIESDSGLTSAPDQTAATAQPTHSGYGTMVFRSGYIISTGNRVVQTSTRRDEDRNDQEIVR